MDQIDKLSEISASVQQPLSESHLKSSVDTNDTRAKSVLFPPILLRPARRWMLKLTPGNRNFIVGINEWENGAFYHSSNQIVDTK